VRTYFTDCDRCGKRFGNTSPSEIEFKDTGIEGLNSYEARKRYDLCDGCKESFVKWMHGVSLHEQTAFLLELPLDKRAEYMRIRDHLEENPSLIP
jgi:hypothetical protein